MLQTVSVFHPKAGKMISGRRNQQARLSELEEKRQGKEVYWFHCASVGEFEQARPLIEKIKKTYPEYFILLTFFSPSGFELRKNYEFADFVTYLPFDTPKNAEKFITAANPKIAVFVKYEFWYHFLSACKRRNVPVFLLSGIFRPEQRFFEEKHNLFREMLSFVHTFFIQNRESEELLKSAGLNNVFITGDTRFDRVWQIRELKKKNDIAEKFAAGNVVIVAGSVWKEDVALLRKLNFTGKKIIAPHEISPKNLEQIEKSFPNTLRFTRIKHEEQETLVKNETLIIDTIGHLSHLYAYGKIAYVGGAFGDGLHNILEPAVFGLPIVFGEKFDKFAEAKDLVALGGAFSVRNAREAKDVFDKLLQDKDFYSRTSEIVRNYVRSHLGATEKVYTFLQENNFIGTPSV
jgi:3-deoxy-D-manno-octulosonic-acid transferase